MIALASITLVLAAVIGAWVAVEYNAPTQGEAQAEAKDHGKREAVDILASERVAYYTKILAILTGGLGALGAIQLFFIYRSDDTARISANAAKRSADVAEATLRATQRAYVSVVPQSSIHVTPNTQQILSMSFWFVMGNNGNAPAIRAVNCCSMAFMVLAEGTVFDYGRSLSGVGIAPMGTIGVNSSLNTSTLTVGVEHMALVADGSADLFVSGWLEYDDIIKDAFEGIPRRGVEWCFKVSIQGQLTPGGCEVRFSIYDNHNRYYDCPPEASKQVVVKPPNPFKHLNDILI